SSGGVGSATHALPFHLHTAAREAPLATSNRPAAKSAGDDGSSTNARALTRPAHGPAMSPASLATPRPPSPPAAPVPNPPPPAAKKSPAITRRGASGPLPSGSKMAYARTSPLVPSPNDDPHPAAHGWPATDTVSPAAPKAPPRIVPTRAIADSLASLYSH